jgi:lauroyl/myristoyl acyltransferase
MAYSWCHRGDVSGTGRRELRTGSPLPDRWHAGALNNGLIFGATYRGVTWLPRSCSYAIGDIGTWIAYHLMRGGTSALVDNFRCVRPEASERELKALALKTYRTYARDTIDFIRSMEMLPEQFKALVAGDNARAIDPLLALRRGVILVGGHFGNWELGGLALRQFKNCEVMVVGRPEPSPTVGALRRRIREKFGIKSIDIGHMLETALFLRRVLAANTVVAMLLDRHFGRDRLDVTFFGRPAPFLRSPAVIARMSGAPLLPASMIRQPDGRFVGWFGTPVFVDASRPGDEPLQRATQAVAAQLETQIRMNPHLWYQFYPYWRSHDSKPASFELVGARPPS